MSLKIAHLTIMEETPAVIVGAGPAGLALALSLAQFEVHSIILEKEPGITEDPRGVVLAGDAVRILWGLGIREQMKTIGHDIDRVNYHKSSFKNPSFFSLNMTLDSLNQTVADGILHVQPKLERAMRDKVEESPYCELRCSSKVVCREELDSGVIVGYEDQAGSLRYIKCSWMIGADGKKGVVRKYFLEPTANIKQETGLFAYTGTWVAANLKIHLPTPETHPEFPLWAHGLTPQKVYDLFWPVGWHFCSPPGKPTACGRFGPYSDRYWRHEFAEPEWDDSMNAEELLWDHLLPMLTRVKDEMGNPFPVGAVTFPKDCIKIRRCRPFTFCQKVVNKWFHNQTILIGDAAHVFPPFGGQGIACGIRDAHGLAWRLALLQRTHIVEKPLADRILTAWALERRQGVDDSTRLTMQNGKLTNEQETLWFFLFRKIMSLFPEPPSQLANVEGSGYKSTKAGFFLSQYGGGGKLAQIYLQPCTARPLLSDQLLTRGQTIMTLLIISNHCPREEANVKAILRAVNMHSSIISEKSIVFLSPDQADVKVESTTENESHEVFYPSPRKDLLEKTIRPGYDESAYLRRLGWTTKYAILRPDYFIFSVARTLPELEQCLMLLQSRLA